MSNKIFLILPFIGSLLAGCSPGYVINAAIEQMSILSSRQEISDVVQDPTIDEKTKHSLKLVSRAREFGISIGLTPKDSFTTYAKLDRDVLSWIVMGAKKDSFQVVGWWFPIVGTVPYRGFFEKSEADAFAKELEQDGYEVWVRPTDAYSTLGWFNDPVLSTTLKRTDEQIVDTVLHESFHQTVWFPGEVAFNETAANVVGVTGAVEFYKGSPNESVANARMESAIIIGQITEALFTALDSLYKQEISSEEKLLKRDQVFDEIMRPYRKLYPSLQAYRQLNNAEVMQFRTYYTNFGLFLDRQRAAGSLSNFVTYLKTAQKETIEQGVSPEHLLKKD